ncbi:PHP domain-containing protein [uncultured Desulfosarcina sp.]|uniref:PHP domain-containing protein n=1 Tax=uncultured Desulfosarcina sp. TaxID=218289 RepID=UPI0029C6C64D|nr:PHP domain-containing protein [uncultured Desulfosarcina sp.]
MMLNQDLHIHTTYSTGDSAIVPEQTVALVASVKHAGIIGISDHFEYLLGGFFDGYAREVRGAGLKVGTEVDGHEWAKEATKYDFDYYIVHCRDRDADYRCLETLLTTGMPVIVAHPNAFDTDLKRVPSECLIEINNRYVWRTDWKKYYTPHKDRFKFVIGSDAHQPNWLGQSMAQYAAVQLGIEEHLVF